MERRIVLTAASPDSYREWNEKMKKDSAGTMKEIEEKIKTEHWMSHSEG
jgi:hypothetical protein